MSMTRTLTALCAALALGMCVTATAATQNAANSKPATPHRSATMAQVVAHFGEPTSKDPAVGQPPITTWHYPNFVVYFEYNRVVDTVVPGQPPELYHRAQLLHGNETQASTQ